MIIDRLKPLPISRAAKLMECDASVLMKAIVLYKHTNGRQGLASLVLPGCKKPRVRPCALDDWMTQLEKDSIYV